MSAGSAQQILEKHQKYVIPGWGNIPIIVTEAYGSRFKDINGKEYIDCLSQTAGVLGIGHRNPRLVKYVKEQVEKATHILTAFVTEKRAQLGEMLAKIAPEPLKDNCKTYFATGGSEANETAIKFAMAKTGKKEVISTWFAYHGGTLALMSLLGQPWHRERFVRFPGFYQIPAAYCYRCPFGLDPDRCDVECARQLEYQLKYGSSHDVAAFIIEPIKGNGGHMYPFRNEYWKIIRETCDKYDVLLIIDEVQTGMGRTGKIWASDLFGIKPDILVTSKAFGGGVPLSACSIRSDLVEERFVNQPWHIFTFGGSPISIVGGIAAIETLLEERLWEKAARQGERMTKRLKEMEQERKLIGEVRGPGLFIGVELVKDKKTKEPAFDETVKVFSKSLEKGVLFGISARAGYGNVIKIKPPLIITDEEADKALDVLEESLKEVERGL